MCRIALLGGSFNPPHVAHQMLCLWVLSTDRADRVWLVPAHEHALHKPLAPFEHRTAMCQLAVAAFPTSLVTVSSIEAEIGGPSRTLITVQRLLERHPEHRFSLLVGADILLQKDCWHRFDAIEQLVELIVVGRPGYPAPAQSVELSSVSSTEIRRRIEAGEDVSQLVPATVRQYVDQHHLYRSHG